MPNKRYLAGRQREWYARDLWRSRGYSVVRSAGSKSPVDLVASNEDEVILIQCKTEGANLKEATDKLLSHKAPAGVRRVVMTWAKTGDWKFDWVDEDRGS